MKNIKKTLLLALSLILVAALSVVGTLAYLKDTDQDVNTMTVGNVHIAQHEYERAENNSESYRTLGTEEKTVYELKEFTQKKPLYPAVVENTNTTSVQVNFNELGKKYTKTVEFVEDINNAQDKIVFVENTGESDAYVRTIIAYEMGSLTVEDFAPTDGSNPIINRVVNDTSWTARPVGVADIGGHNYYLVEHVYKSVLHPGEFTEYSLSQVYMDSRATNEHCEALDGNGNGTYDILVFSQATQTAGFVDKYNPDVALNAAATLDEVFGDTTVGNDTTPANHPWNNTEDKTSNTPVWVSSETDLDKALEDTTKKYVVLKEDIKVSATLNIEGSKTLNLNGHKIITDNKYTGIFVSNAKTELTITGNGEINAQNASQAIYVIAGIVNLKGVTINDAGYGIITNGTGQVNINDAKIKCRNAAVLVWKNSNKVNIYDGIYHATNATAVPLESYATNDAITVYGGTFIKYSSYNKHKLTKYVAEGYEPYEVPEGSGTYKIRQINAE